MNRRIANSPLLTIFGALVIAMGLAARAEAQVKDQEQPSQPYEFNADATWATWQQQITVGIAGQLAGFDMYIWRAGSAEIYVTAGSPWQYGDPDFITILEASAPGWIYVDVTSADLHFEVDDEFIIGARGIGDLLFFGGSSPSSGGPYDGGDLWFEYGVYQGGQYDMAFQTWVLVACAADITGDEIVDVLDLLEVLSQWGTAGSADITGDGVVDVLDLLEVLSAWGPC